MKQRSGSSRKAFTLQLILSCLLLTACQHTVETGRSREAVEGKSEKASAAVAPAPGVEILVDEALLRKPHAVLGGTVKNVGAERLEDLSLEIELTRRSDGSTERREVSVEPREIAPGGSGKYSLKVLSEEWSGSRLVRLRSAPGERELAFKTLPGARRPPEKNATVTRVIQDTRPRATSKGEEFINTPDTATSVP